MLSSKSLDLLPNLILLLAAGLLISMTSTTATAQDSKPVQVSLVNPIQIFPEDTAIKGVRLNVIYGKNVAVTGLDIGIINHSGSDGFRGLQYGLVGISDDDFIGWQNNFINISKGEVQGFQSALVNTTPNMSGFQLGFVNHANDMSGFQLGLVNFAERMTKGLQIGVVNIIREGGRFPVFPVVNWAF